jgi:hypothetical protein
LKTCFKNVARGLKTIYTPPHVRLRQDKEADNTLFPVATSTALTEGEAALIKSIFGKTVKTDKVQRHYSTATKFAARKGYVTAATTFGNDIKFYGPPYGEADYSTSTEAYNYGTFVHEMTHVWQNQHHLRKRFHDTLHRTYRYDYTLKKHSRFAHFGEEQQASLVEDYVRQFFLFRREVEPDHRTQYIPAAAPSPPPAEAVRNLYLLQKVVEDQFPEARKTRLRLEAEKNTAQTAPSPATAQSPTS